MDLPYVIRLGEGNWLAISLPGEWLKCGHDGAPLLLPPAIRAIDRMRAMFAKHEQITPGFISSLREAMGITQQDFGRRLGVAKMTVSRWERGTMRPSPAAQKEIRHLQAQAARKGVQIGGSRRVA